MSENSYEWVLFGAIWLALFAALFIFIGTKFDNRVAGAIFCAALALLVCIPVLRNMQESEFLHEHVAMKCLGLVVATVGIIAFISKSK